MIAWNCKHYKGRGIMKAYRNMGEFANVYTSQKQTRGHLQGLHPSSLGPDFATFEDTQAGFSAAHTQQVSLADLIVLGGCVGVEIAAKAEDSPSRSPFSAGRGDATAEETDASSLQCLSQ